MPAFHPSRLARAILLVTGGALPWSALAQGPVEEIVVSASGISQRLVDAPASISVVTGDELQLKPYTTLIDAVRELEGVDVGETSDKTGQRSISLRGMGADYTLILIDGKRQNNHGDIYPNSFGGNQFNHVPPLDMIERIEVIRGPASTLYGADALGGVINIITKKVSPVWRASLTASHNLQENDAFGADTTYDFSVHGPLLGETLGLGLRGSRYEREASLPEYEEVLDPDGGVHERAMGFGGGGKTADNTNESLGATLSWRIDERQSLVFDYDVSRQVYDNTPRVNNLGTIEYPLGTVDNIESLWRRPTDPPRVGYAAGQKFTRDQWSIAHSGEWGFANSFLSLAYIDTGNHGRTLPFTVEERLQHTRMRQGLGEYAGMSEAERRTLMEASFLPRPKRTMESRQYTLDAKFDIPLSGFMGDHHLVLGGQIIDGELEDGVFGMESGSNGAGTVQAHEMRSVFAENNWTPVEPFTLTVGLRHDSHNRFGGNLSPRVYGVWTLSDAWTLKGGVSTGYKTPKTTDLYDGVIGFGGQGTNPFVGNPDLEPETSVNTEVALYWTGESGHNANLTVFSNDFKDKIARGTAVQDCALNGNQRPCVNLGAWTQLGNTQYNQNINIDTAEIKGLEFAGRYQILESLALRGNYTFTDSEQTSGPEMGQPLTDTARHMANATLDWSLSPALSLQLVFEARSKRYRGVDSQGNHIHYRDYEVFHLGGRYQFSERLTFNARINNLLDQDFTSFQSSFVRDAGGAWVLETLDDYNNKDKARNLWLSANYSF